MANTPKVLYRGAAATSNTTLYTVPSATTTIVTNIIVTNTDSASATFTLKLDGVDLISGASILANSIATFDLKQVIETTELIEGSASATTINFHISGMEMA